MIIKNMVKELGSGSIIIAIEELAELVQAVTKVMRGRPDYNNLAEEVADVQLMLKAVEEFSNVSSYGITVCDELDYLKCVKDLTRLSDILCDLLVGEADYAELKLYMKRVENAIDFIKNTTGLSKAEIDNWKKFKLIRISNQIVKGVLK